MPLVAQILRDGEAIPLRWGNFHLAAMVLASTLDTGEGPFTENTPAALFGGGENIPGADDEITLTRQDVLKCTFPGYPIYAACAFGSGPYVLKRGYKFRDADDGELLELHAGDTLSAIRGF